LEPSLSDAQRDTCLHALDRDSFCILPVALPQCVIDRANAYIDGYCAEPSRYLAPERPHDARRPLLSGNGSRSHGPFCHHSDDLYGASVNH
jgi:hypothetical protein